MRYDRVTKKRFHRIGRENNVKPALVPMAGFMREHVAKMYRDNRDNPAISDLDSCFKTMRRSRVLNEVGLIVWNIWNNSHHGRGKPVLWDCGRVTLSIACCTFVDPPQIKTVYPETYERWLDDLLTNLSPRQAIVDVMFGLDGNQMAVHMSFISPQQANSTKRGFCILATDLTSG